MLNQKVADLLNQQINKEFYSAYLYLDLPIVISITQGFTSIPKAKS